MPSLTRETVAPEHLRRQIEEFVSLHPRIQVLETPEVDWDPPRREVIEALEDVRKRMEKLYGRGIREKARAKKAKYWNLWLEMRQLLFRALELKLWSFKGVHRNLNTWGVIPIYLGDTLVIRTPFREFLSWETGEVVASEDQAADSIRKTA